MIPLPEALFWLLLVALPYVVLRVRRAWVLYGLLKRRRELRLEATEAIGFGFRHQYTRCRRDLNAIGNRIERASQVSLLRWTP